MGAARSRARRPWRPPCPRGTGGGCKSGRLAATVSTSNSGTGEGRPHDLPPHLLPHAGPSDSVLLAAMTYDPAELFDSRDALAASADTVSTPRRRRRVLPK